MAARWRNRLGLTGGQGVARPVGTPWGSDGGCVGQGGGVGFSSETAGGGGAKKTVQRNGVPRWRWSFGGRGGRRRGPTAGGGDRGGEVRSKRGRRRGHEGAHRKARETVVRQREDSATAVVLRSSGHGHKAAERGEGG
jgi:hypothetical protein